MGLVQGHGINDMPYGWASENEWNKRVYKKWADMIRRCYNEEYHKTHPTYIGCSVCDRWLILSNFIEDVPKITGYNRERFLNGELELDKDKKKDENKRYVMKYCTWLPKPENCSLAHKWKELSEEHKQKISEVMQGKHHTEETKRKISEVMQGKHHTEESKQKMSEAHKGKTLSEETKQKISEGHKGKQHTEETKQKMSEAKQGKLGSECPNSKKVAQYNKQTLELIKIWDSMMDVERELGIVHSNISKCCKGKYKSTGGFIWKYVED